MDDKRTALAIFLSMLVILVYYEMVVGPQVPPPSAQRPAVSSQAEAGVGQPASPEAAVPAAQMPSAAPAGAAQPSRIPAYVEYTTASSITIESDKMRAVISSLGARLLSCKLKEFKQTLESPDPLELVPVGNPFPPLGVYTGGVSDADTTYELRGFSQDVDRDPEGVFQIGEGQQLSLNFEGQLSNGVKITKTVRFTAGSYVLNVETTLSAPPQDNSNLWLEWATFIPEDSPERSYDPRGFTVLQADNSVKRITLKELTNTFRTFSAQWSGFGDIYFMSALIPKTAGANAMIARQANVFFNRVIGDKTAGAFSIYAGPKDFATLAQTGMNLTSSVDLGFFAPIGQPLLYCIEYLYQLLGNYGLAIIVLTLILKTVLLPLTAKTFKSMKAMQDLKPQVDALRKRIEDPNELNQAMLALYREKGVNPMGGCMPMVIQLPIFLGMYNALRTSFNLRHQPFALWINDLSSPEGLQIMGVHVPVMILIMGLTMFVQQITTPSAGATPEQRKMMLMMPVIFTVMFLIWPFPSGLVLYWLVNNLISIIQQVALRTERNITPLQATALGSIAILGVGFLLTWI